MRSLPPPLKKKKKNKTRIAHRTRVSGSKRTGLLPKRRHTAKPKQPRGGRRCASALSPTAPHGSGRGAPPLFAQPRHPLPSQRQIAAPGECSHKLLAPPHSRLWLHAPGLIWSLRAGLAPAAHQDFPEHGTEKGFHAFSGHCLPPSSVVPRRIPLPAARTARLAFRSDAENSTGAGERRARVMLGQKPPRALPRDAPGVSGVGCAQHRSPPSCGRADRRCSPSSARSPPAPRRAHTATCRSRQPRRAASNPRRAHRNATVGTILEQHEGDEEGKPLSFLGDKQPFQTPQGLQFALNLHCPVATVSPRQHRLPPPEEEPFLTTGVAESEWPKPSASLRADGVG